jgi:hypothetical protein
MSDLRDFTGKNRIFTGTDGMTISSGTTGQRVNGTAKLRFNTTTNLMEYYTGTDWKSIDAPPTITQFTLDGGSDVTSASINSGTGGNATIEVKGSLFDTTGATVTFEGTSESISTQSITRNSANLLTVTVARADFDNTNEPYAIKVSNGSGLSADLADAIVQDQPVVFNNAADTIYSVFDSVRGSINTGTTFAATDADSDTITYSITAGALPSGLSLSSSTAAVTGSTSAVGSDTTSTFTIQAATTNLTITRQFKITLKAPVISTFNSPGTFSAPAEVTSVNTLVVAGGGTGGNQHGGGGGGGGLIYRPGFPISPGGSFPISIGAGGAGMPGIGSNGTRPDGNGANTTFSTLTAIGGGQGPSHNGSGGGLAGQPGGSGGGGNSDPSGTPPGGTGTQPSQSGDSGTYGFGNNGGAGHPATNWTGGGGGGAGGAGSNASGPTGGPGGAGRSYNISGSSVGYAGGGGGGGHNTSGGASGGSGASAGSGPHPANASGATANRGGGAGGAASGGNTTGPGGSGVVIVSY